MWLASLALSPPVRAQDGHWVTLGGATPRARVFSGFSYDGRAHRWILTGGMASSTGGFVEGWTIANQPDATWLQQTPGVTFNGNCTTTIDDATGELYSFGQYVTTSPLWIVKENLATGTVSGLSGSLAPGMDDHGALSALDPVRHRVILFGGGTPGKTWSEPASSDGPRAWTELVTATPAPSNVSGAIAYDAFGDRLIAYLLVATTSIEWWELRFRPVPTWTRLATESPTAPYPWGMPMALDPVGRRLIGYSHQRLYSSPLEGTPHWTEIPMSGTAPAASTWAQAAYDPATQRFAFFGGLIQYDPYFPTYSSELSVASLGATPQWLPQPPPFAAVAEHTAAMDAQGRLWVVGGDPVSSGGANHVWRTDLHALTKDGLHFVEPSGAPAGTLTGHTQVHDAARSRMLMFGGGTPAGSDALNVLDLSGHPAWSTLSVVGPAPGPRFHHSAVFDAAYDRMLVFGGRGMTPGAPPIHDYNDVWQLTLSGSPAWQLLQPSGTPPSPRESAMMVLDRTRNRLIVIGGRDANGVPLNDAWSLSLTGTPAWSPLVTSGFPPPPLTGAAAVFDPVHDRLLIDGGVSATGFSPETWELQLGSVPAWRLLHVELANQAGYRKGQAAAFDQERDLAVFVGGTRTADALGANALPDPLWAVAPMNTLDSPPQPLPSRLRFERVSPNPSRGEAALTFALPQAADLELTIMDPAGRAVRVLAKARFAAGVHRLAWDGRGSSGGLAPAGLYFAVLESRGERLVQRIARLH